MFPAAVIDAGLGIIVRLTYYPGSTPVWRRGLRDLSTTVGDFRVDIPAGLTVTGEPAASAAGALTAGRSGRGRCRQPRHSVSIQWFRRRAALDRTLGSRMVLASSALPS